MVLQKVIERLKRGVRTKRHGVDPASEVANQLVLRLIFHERDPQRSVARVKSVANEMRRTAAQTNGPAARQTRRAAGAVGPVEGLEGEIRRAVLRVVLEHPPPAVAKHRA